MGQKVLIYNLLPDSISHYHASEQREQRSLAPLPLTQDQVQQPHKHKHAQIRMRAHVIRSRTPTCLRVCTGPKALGELGIGDCTPRRWVGDSELGGLRLGGDCTLVWEGTWGCAAQFMGGRASDRPVLSLLHPAFAASNPNERTPTAQSRNAPHQPHAHPTPNTNTKPNCHLPNKHVLNPHSNSGSAH